MSRRDPFEDLILGLSWGDVGDASKWAFQNVVHPLGKGLASSFGAGAAAQSLEDIERGQGWLPPATKGPPPGAPPPMGGRVPPGAMPMSKPTPTSATPTTPTAKRTSFLQKWKKPIEYGAGAALAIGVVMLVVNAASKGKRK